MADLLVEFTRDKGHWRITFKVDGDVEPGGILACRDGILPVLACLTAGKLEHDARSRGTYPDAGSSPPTVTMSTPNGDWLTFELTHVHQRGAKFPERFGEAFSRGRAAQPIDTSADDAAWKTK